jgi:eukaryotic-like serine/threonine-protein kinase
VVVRGAAGVGKSRIVQWIADRAHEVGAASVLETEFTAPDSALENLRRSTVKFLRSHPLSAELRDQRFGELLSGLRLDRIVVADAIELLLDPERMELPDVQRLVLIRRIWEILAVDRPLLATTRSGPPRR